MVVGVFGVRVHILTEWFWYWGQSGHFDRMVLVLGSEWPLWYWGQSAHFDRIFLLLGSGYHFDRVVLIPADDDDQRR